MHHHAEDADFFDELEETNPAIGPVIERLRADHRVVSGYLDAVEAAARALTEDDGQDARRSVAEALEVLKGHLLTHLEYEELNVAGTARRLRDFRSRTLTTVSPSSTAGSPRDSTGRRRRTAG
jgi:hemerythrin-like domain-containing protein